MNPNPTSVSPVGINIHPANSFLTHEVVAKTALDISLDEQPHWVSDPLKMALTGIGP